MNNSAINQPNAIELKKRLNRAKDKHKKILEIWKKSFEKPYSPLSPSPSYYNKNEDEITKYLDEKLKSSRRAHNQATKAFENAIKKLKDSGKEIPKELQPSWLPWGKGGRKTNRKTRHYKPSGGNPYNGMTSKNIEANLKRAQEEYRTLDQRINRDEMIILAVKIQDAKNALNSALEQEHNSLVRETTPRTSSWLPWRRGGRKTHHKKRHTRKGSRKIHRK
jgi:hypothetical protein